MANPEHINVLSKGVEYWNKWRADNPDIIPDVKGKLIASLASSSDEVILNKGEVIGSPGINLSRMDLFQERMESMNLVNANLTETNLYEADLSYARMQDANLYGCNLRKAYMSYAKLQGAKLINANLNRANLVHANLSGATIENCIVYGASAWGIITDGATIQRNLILEDTNYTGESLSKYFFSSSGHYPLMVDDIEIAQFIHLLTNYKNLGKAITAMLDKGILILGKFRDGGKDVLMRIADKLRSMNFLPIIFDFENANESSITETVTTLAGISRFVVVDLSGPSVPAELERITSSYNRPVISFSRTEDEKKIYSMFKDILRKREVLYMKYNSLEELDEKLLIKLKEAEKLMHQIIYEKNELVLKKLEEG